MPSEGGTHGPPLSLQPGDPAMAISMPYCSPEGDGVFESVLPLRRHVDQAMVDDLRRLQCGVEVLKARQADAMHPVEIELDALLGDVAVHPVPPHAGTSALGRILETALERIGRGFLLRACDNCGHNDERGCYFEHLAGHTSPLANKEAVSSCRNVAFKSCAIVHLSIASLTVQGE